MQPDEPDQPAFPLPYAGAHHGVWRGVSIVGVIFLLSRIAFYLATSLGTLMLPESTDWCTCTRVPGPLLLAMHWRWDSLSYYTIATAGYTQEHLRAFFPLFPLLLYGTTTVLNHFVPPPQLDITAAGVVPLLAGIVVTNVATFLAFWLFYQLVNEETHDERLASRAVLYLAIFPLAFFYAVPYTESLFLACSLGTFLAARRGHWIQAGLWVAAASATRLVGVFLIPAVVVEIGLAIQEGGPRSVKWRSVAGGLLLAPIGALGFFLYLRQQTGDLLAPMHAQAAWGRTQTVPFSSLWRGLGYVRHPAEVGRLARYGVNLLDCLIVVGVLLVTLVSLRTWRSSNSIYAILLLGVALSTPLPGARAMQSTGRYVMVLFPVYITFAHWSRRPLIHDTILVLSLPLYGLLAALHTRWYFIG